jgi:hypothetical protein
MPPTDTPTPSIHQNQPHTPPLHIPPTPPGDWAKFVTETVDARMDQHYPKFDERMNALINAKLNTPLNVEKDIVYYAKKSLPYVAGAVAGAVGYSAWQKYKEATGDRDEGQDR